MPSIVIRLTYDEAESLLLAHGPAFLNFQVDLLSARAKIAVALTARPDYVPKDKRTSADATAKYVHK